MVRVIVLNYTWAFSDIRIQPENDGRRLGGRTFEFRSARPTLKSGCKVGCRASQWASCRRKFRIRIWRACPNAPSRCVTACDIPCRTFRALDASGCVTVASIGQREVQIQADGGRAAGVRNDAESDFSAAEGFHHDAHADIRREAQRQTRPRRRSKLQVLARARTDTCRLGAFA